MSELEPSCLNTGPDENEKDIPLFLNALCEQCPHKDGCRWYQTSCVIDDEDEYDSDGEFWIGDAS